MATNSSPLPPPPPKASENGSILVYIVRRDLRLSDNPILHHVAREVANGSLGFTHFLPVYVFPAQQIEISGFERFSSQWFSSKNPYPPAVSHRGKFSRCGPHRAKFIAECVWDMKTSLEQIGSGLVIRVGMLADVVKSLIDGFKGRVGAVWMTTEDGIEETEDEMSVATICGEKKASFKLWPNLKALIDLYKPNGTGPKDGDNSASQKAIVQFCILNSAGEPFHRPDVNDLPPLPPRRSIPEQTAPFIIPDNYSSLKQALLKPLQHLFRLVKEHTHGETKLFPQGGETAAWECLNYSMKRYGKTLDNSTWNPGDPYYLAIQIGAYLSHGCLTARQVHHHLAAFESGTCLSHSDTRGFGMGMNKCTFSTRKVLLHRDYVRVCARAMQASVFVSKGTPEADRRRSRGISDTRDDTLIQNVKPYVLNDYNIDQAVEKFIRGKTGNESVDSAMHELFRTGTISNSLRHQAAQYLFNNMGIDWVYGAEWHETWLIDYDVSVNWVNWKHYANNSLARAFDTDMDGHFLREWLPRSSRVPAIEGLKTIRDANSELDKLLKSTASWNLTSTGGFSLISGVGKLGDKPRFQYIKPVETSAMVLLHKIKNKGSKVYREYFIPSPCEGKMEEDISAEMLEAPEPPTLDLFADSIAAFQYRAQERAIEDILNRLEAHQLARMFSDSVFRQKKSYLDSGDKRLGTNGNGNSTG